MLKTVRYVISVSVAVSLVILLAYGNGLGAGKLRTNIPSDLVNLDPEAIIGNQDNSIAWQVFQGLPRCDGTANIMRKEN